MKKRKILLLLLLMLSLFLVACGDDKDDKEDKEEEQVEEVELDDETKENIELIQEKVEALAKHRKEFSSYVKEYKKTDQDGLEDLIDEIEDIIGEIEKVDKKIAKLPKDAEYEDAVATYAAAKVYVAEVKGVYEDMLFVCKFVDELMETTDELLEEDFECDTLADFERVYGVWQEFVDDLPDIDCPEYLEHEYNIVIDSYEKCEEIYKTLYLGAYYEDSLRITSAGYMLEVAIEEANQSANELDSNIAEQLDYMKGLTGGRLETMETELLDNCEAILDEKEVAEYAYLDDDDNIVIDYEYVDEIYPALYNHMDSIVTIKASCENEEKELLVSVEIDGFTQIYEQTYTVGNRVEMWDIKPAISKDVVDLSSMKEMKIVVTVEDVDTGKVYLKDTNDVEIMSKYDWPSVNDDGNQAFYSVLAWLEPESAQIKELKRLAAEYVSYFDISGMGSTSIVGYQGTTDINEAYDIVLEQVLAMQFAMADMGVKYNMSPFSVSTSENYVQRVTTPTETLESKSGICIETSLVIASAVQAADMNAMLVLTPGHCQVAVEIFESGEYFLVETTSIPEYVPETWDELSDVADTMIGYYTPEEWQQFITKNQNKGYCYIIECDMAKPMGYLPFSN
ncbi:MAG: hypothetical protein J6L69_09120 [Lachnospiraceae bacterium]|nr:hypothetical protein [Lachnospiraceae bacterium]